MNQMKRRLTQERKSTRNIVERAIELAKSNKKSTWEALATGRVARWGNSIKNLPLPEEKNETDNENDGKVKKNSPRRISTRNHSIITA